MSSQGLKCPGRVEEIKLVVAALMGALLQRNFQRLGAAAQATLEEFENIEAVNEGGEEVRVMWVARHKTAWQGPAYLVMTTSDYKLLRRYVKRVRSHLDPTKVLEQLFVLHIHHLLTPLWQLQ